MVNIEFYNNLDKGRGYEFSLFPFLVLMKTSWIKYYEYDLCIGFWFWSMEISWDRNK